MSEPSKDEVREALATDADVKYWFVVSAAGDLAMVGRDYGKCVEAAARCDALAPESSPHRVETGTDPRLN